VTVTLPAIASPTAIDGTAAIAASSGAHGFFPTPQLREGAAKGLRPGERLISPEFNKLDQRIVTLVLCGQPLSLWIYNEKSHLSSISISVFHAS
jgi:hypothetical protein